MSVFSGGAERSMFSLVQNCKNKGYNPIVVLPEDGNINKAYTSIGIETIILHYDWWAHLKDSPEFGAMLKNSTTINSLCNILIDKKPILCVSYTSVVPWLAYASKICGIPHIWNITELLNNEEKWTTRLPIANIFSIINLLSDKIFTNSLFMKEQLSELIQTKKSIDIIYPYINKDDILKNTAVHMPKEINPQNINISLVGNIEPAKGQLDAVRAISILKDKYPSIILFIIGDIANINYYNKLSAFIAKNNLKDNIIFTGKVSNPHIYTKNSSISLVTSKNEPFGRVTIESMLIGTPVIGSDSAGTKEIILSSNKYGILYKFGDSQMLAEKIDILLQNPTKSALLARNALDYALKKFSLENTQKSFFTYLDSLQHQYDAPDIFLNDVQNCFSCAIAEQNLIINGKDQTIHHLKKVIAIKDNIITDKDSFICNIRKSIFYRILRKLKFFK